MSDGELVQLYVYDLSGGLARSLSPALLGRQIDAVYHTSVVVGTSEIYFGGGICMSSPGATPFGRPIEILELGHTQLDQDLRESLLVDLSHRYAPETYSLFSNNCNTFSDELAQLLTGRGIPQHITALPQTVLETPFGQMMRPMLAGLEEQMRSMRGQAFVPSASGGGGGEGGEGISAHQAVPQEAIAETTPTCTPGEGPALLAAEHALEVAAAETAMAELQEKTAELELKEGTATPAQQLGEEGAVRFATEKAVAKEYEKLVAAGHAAGEDSEALALERVAARLATCGSGSNSDISNNKSTAPP